MAPPATPPTRLCPLSRSSTLYAGSAMSPTHDAGLTRLMLASALAGALLVVAVVASLPLGTLT